MSIWFFFDLSVEGDGWKEFKIVLIVYFHPIEGVMYIQQFSMKLLTLMIYLNRI